jgi:hypothetical protein
VVPATADLGTEPLLAVTRGENVYRVPFRATSASTTPGQRRQGNPPSASICSQLACGPGSPQTAVARFWRAAAERPFPSTYLGRHRFRKPARQARWCSESAVTDPAEVAVPACDEPSSTRCPTSSGATRRRGSHSSKREQPSGLGEPVRALKCLHIGTCAPALRQAQNSRSRIDVRRLHRLTQDVGLPRVANSVGADALALAAIETAAPRPVAAT